MDPELLELIEWVTLSDLFTEVFYSAITIAKENPTMKELDIFKMAMNEWGVE